jgi:hypothetical protein
VESEGMQGQDVIFPVKQVWKYDDKTDQLILLIIQGYVYIPVQQWDKDLYLQTLKELCWS